jgi:signal transduction histidine kinase
MPPLRKKLLLVVDDTPTNIAVLSGVLKDSFRIKVATNGKKALAMARAPDQPDLILLDVVMPGMDGFEVCRHLKATTTTREIPVIFLTGVTDAENEEKGFEIGAVDYIHKPFSAPIVLARVRTQLAFQAALRQAGEARDQAEELLHALRAELAGVARLTAMGELAASIAHEIRQPLAAVVNNANAGLRWLNNQPPNLKQVRTALKRIVRDSERGGDVLGSIQGMLKKGEEERARLDINDLIREVMRLVQGELKNRGVSSRAELADDLPRVLADRIQLRQVILNLIMNAIEAMVSVSDRAPRVLRVRSENHGDDGVLVAVEDSGSGIAPEDMDRIFETFFTTKSEGMGMGLSICRSIVESHGGRIGVASKSVGSVLQFFLPTAEPSDHS